MARRSTAALYSGKYNPKAATAARLRKGTTGPKQAAKLARKVAAAERRREGVLASPRGKRLGQTAKERALGPQSSWPEEWRYLRRQAVLDIRGTEGYGALWRDLVDEQYTQAIQRPAAHPPRQAAEEEECMDPRSLLSPPPAGALERMAAAGDPRAMTDEQLRVAALDEALYAPPRRLGAPWPPAIAEHLSRRASR